MGRLNKSAPKDAEIRFDSAGQTNAKDLTPNLREDVVRGAKQDAERIKKGMDTSETRTQNRSQVQNAAGRAITRMASRAGLAGAALEGGYEAGRAIDEKTGLGKKMVEKSGLGDLAERVVNSRDKVELSKEAKERIAKSEPIEARFRKSEGKEEPPEMATHYKPDNYKSGGKINVSRRADGIAQRGKTRGKVC
jgi:hypothetical protein